MNTKTISMQFAEERESSLVSGPMLSSIYQKSTIALWLLIAIVSGISWVLSIYSLNVWDRVPATELPHYFPRMTPEDVQAVADWKNTVLQTGFSLPGYAWFFTTIRIIAGLSLFLVSFLLIRHYSDHLMAVLMAMFLSILAAAGIWGNPLFGWAVALAPWMHFPSLLLGWLLWCGAIVIYMFPNGKFTPRWTVWLAVLLVPMTFLSAFGVDIFLNTDSWPAPFYLLPELFFIGGALFAVIYRYIHMADAIQKRALRWYTIGLSLLIGVHFVNLFITDIFNFLAGHPLVESNVAMLNYVLLNEPIWFACETLIAVGLAIAALRRNALRS